MTTSVDLTWLAMERARYETLFDSLTELPRWGLFLDRTAVALERAEYTGSGIAVFILDEPHLPNENNHDIRRVVDRLRSRLRPGDTLARLGDERFAAMCCDVANDCRRGDARAPPHLRLGARVRARDRAQQVR